MRTAFLISLTFLLAADDKAPLNRTRDREVDIHHMKIDVTVDLKAESVYGHVIHTLSPLSASLKTFALDAEDMTIRRVRHKGKDILFDHSGDKLFITLDNEIGWSDTLNVRIDYTSFPRVGAFFISPDETYPDKPWQAWTQGEDTDNHHWVPMYDYPNERNTFEIL